MVLSFLPLPSLLRMQAVNSQWRDLIQDSSALQQQLFFKPEKSNKIWLVEVANLPAQQRPLPRNFRSNLHVLAEVSRHSGVPKDYQGLVATPVTVNRLFLWPDPFLDDPEDIDKKADRGFIAEYCAKHSFLQTISHHSMRDMLLTQPPVTNLSAEVLNEYGLHSAKISEPEGIRLHHVISGVEKIGMLDRAESIKLFMSGVVEPTERDMREIQKRTADWHRAEAEREG